SLHSRAAQIPRDREAVLARQHDIQKNQIEWGLLRETKGRLAVAGNLDGISFQRQIVAQAKRNAGLVFDNQDRTHCGSSLPGRMTRNVLPFPRSLSRVICPPCARTISRAIARPMPAPPVLVSRAAVPRKNFSKTIPCSACGIPTPPSRTAISTCETLVLRSTQTVSHPGEYLTAFSKRFQNTHRIVSRSAWTMNDSSRSTLKR